ncbi:MAG: response regulator [Chloroflexota bacterium]|nr:response regulator [Chloroflexota bacterium]
MPLSSPSRCPVLVVDDDHAIREALSMILEDEGYVVETAENGHEALQYLQHGGRPCLIVLDLKMPVMTGQEFRAEQQRDTTISSIPVAIISAHIVPGMKPEVEADAFLPKPINYDEFLDTVASYCPGSSCS